MPLYCCLTKQPTRAPYRYRVLERASWLRPARSERAAAAKVRRRALQHRADADRGRRASARACCTLAAFVCRARSFDLEVTPWAPTRLTSSIFHSGHTEAYEPLRSTRRPARAPFNHLAAPGSTRKPPVCRSGISGARSFDLASKCAGLAFPGPEASTWRWRPGRRPDLPPLSSIQVTRRHMSPFDRPAAPPAHPSTTSPRRDRPASLQVCRSGISGARSFDLEVAPWAPTRLTSSIFHSGHTEAYEPLRSTRHPARAPFNHHARMVTFDVLAISGQPKKWVLIIIGPQRLELRPRACGVPDQARPCPGVQTPWLCSKLCYCAE
eukprot:COSAG04_NODE_3203_length_3051_cov_88.951220_4_plen_324_part_00